MVVDPRALDQANHLRHVLAPDYTKHQPADYLTLPRGDQLTALLRPQAQAQHLPSVVDVTIIANEMAAVMVVGR